MSLKRETSNADNNTKVLMKLLELGKTPEEIEAYMSMITKFK